MSRKQPIDREATDHELWQALSLMIEQEQDAAVERYEKFCAGPVDEEEMCECGHEAFYHYSGGGECLFEDSGLRCTCRKFDSVEENENV